MDFVGLLSAVRPKKRTDQYMVLSALFHLNAQRTPVISTQVAELLELHLQRKAPKNVSDTLRKSSPYVAPAAKGPPLLWSLTPKGIERLRNLSQLALPETSNENYFQTDIGIICALEDPEFAAVMDAFGGSGAWKETGSARFTHVYRETELKINTGEILKVVATTSTSMGLTAAAIATTQLVLQFTPRIVVMIGIAAGTRAGNKQFGDVLVADPSVDYNSGKVAQEKGIREFLPDAGCRNQFHWKSCRQCFQHCGQRHGDTPGRHDKHSPTG